MRSSSSVRRSFCLFASVWALLVWCLIVLAVAPPSSLLSASTMLLGLITAIAAAVAAAIAMRIAPPWPRDFTDAAWITSEIFSGAAALAGPLVCLIIAVESGILHRSLSPFLQLAPYAVFSGLMGGFLALSIALPAALIGVAVFHRLLQLARYVGLYGHGDPASPGPAA